MMNPEEMPTSLEASSGDTPTSFGASSEAVTRMPDDTRMLPDIGTFQKKLVKHLANLQPDERERLLEEWFVALKQTRRELNMVSPEGKGLNVNFESIEENFHTAKSFSDLRHQIENLPVQVFEFIFGAGSHAATLKLLDVVFRNPADETALKRIPKKLDLQRLVHRFAEEELRKRNTPTGQKKAA